VIKELRAGIAELKAMKAVPGPRGLTGKDGTNANCDDVTVRLGLLTVRVKALEQKCDAECNLDEVALAERIKRRIQGSIIVTVEPLTPD